MSKKTNKSNSHAPPPIENQTSGRNSGLSARWKWIGGAALILLVAGVFAFRQFGSEAFQAKRTTRPVGFVNGCYKLPTFIQTLNFTNQAALSTSEKSPGLWLIEKDQQGNARRYQHPSWKAAGFLAPIQRDDKGNVFVAPAPVINTLLNPIDRQNIVYRVDGRTQEMKPFVTLETTAPPNEQNPYGTLGLAFDCETKSIYVSSVFGSTRNDENGIVYRINAESGKITSQLPNIDAMGIGVFNGSSGKKLYFGVGRASEVRSVALDDNGDFVGAPQKALSLTELGSRGDDKARRITFTNKNEMIVYGIEFSFNLVAPTEKQETLYRFTYDAKNDRWIFSPNQEPA